MKLFVSLLLFTLTGVSLVYTRIEVSSNITSIMGKICPETVQFTCVATDFETTLLWGFNTLSSTMFRYVLNTMDAFPLTIFGDGNVTVVILSAVQNPQDLDRADFTSTLTVSLTTLISRGVQRVFCGTSLENDNYNLMLNDVTVRAPPPRPEFSCSLADDGESVTFNWSNSYNSKYSVNHYCIESLPCSACNISPDTLYVCDGLQVGMEYVIILKAVNCDVQRGAAESINITLQETTQAPSNLKIVSLFNSFALTQVTVKWNGAGDKYSVKCDHKSTTYVVTLQNTVNTSIERQVNSDSCVNSMCNTNFNISKPEGNYSISVHAVSIVGTSTTKFPSAIPANATSLLRASFHFANCITYATCSSDTVEDGNCWIRYSSISDSESVTGMLDSTFALPLLTPDTRYDFVTNLTINSGFIVEVETTFVTGNFDPKLTRSNIAMIVVGSIFAIIATVCDICGAIAVVWIYFRKKCLGTCLSHKSEYGDDHEDNDQSSTAPVPQPDESFVLVERPVSKLSNRLERPIMVCILILCGVSLILVCVTIILWTSLGGVVGQQQNTCEVSWQTSRDNLTAVSFFFSILSLIVCFVFILVLSRKNKVSAWLRNLMVAPKQIESISTEDEKQISDGNEQELEFDQYHFSPDNQQGPESPPNGDQKPGTSEMTVKDGTSDTTTHSETNASGDTSVDTKHASNDREAGDGMTNSGSHLQVDPPVEAAAASVYGEADNEVTTTSDHLTGAAVTELKIIRQPQPWGADTDENVTFTVTASSKNNLSFEWTRNGKTFKHDDKIQQTESGDGKKSTIQMMFSPTQHAGMYKCVVKDKMTGESLSSNVVELKNFADKLKIMKSSRPLKNELVIAIIGRTGMGKITLFNSLIGDRVITEPVNCQSHEINNINVKVRLVSKPGFGAKSTTDTMEKTADRIPENGDDVDLVIYCVSMAKDSHLNKKDDDSAGELTKTYDQYLWQKMVCALTFANSYVSKQEEKDPVEATKFNKAVVKCTESVHTELLKRFSTEVADSIPIVPVGCFMTNKGESQCTLPDGSNWLSSFWYQSLVRIRDPQAQYAFYVATRNIHPYLRDYGHRKNVQY